MLKHKTEAGVSVMSNSQFRIYVDSTSKNPRGEIVDISSILKTELTSSFLRGIDVIFPT